MSIAYRRYYESNVPVEYWDLDLKNFTNANLITIHEKITHDISKSYKDGLSLCFAGLHGVGKSSLLSCVLKTCCQKNYTCLYTTMTDLVNALIDAPRDDKYLVKKELTMIDFLVIDELDGRFIGSEASSDLFGKSLEHIIRTRSQNKLPTFFASNSPNPIEAFSGALKQSIDSLMSKVKIIPVIGKDFRKNS
jgi:DNA replication protein DnaC